MEAINFWLRENAALFAAFFLFWCVFFLDRITRAVRDIQFMMRKHFNQRRDLDD
jgi:hypothetical protein